ncbi:MAG TPA: ATP-binding protein [Anaerolineae bacterium]|nr:ATP-binding protein [Anaerolineae bacterium]
MREIALHLLDIAENSVAAGAKTIEIMVEEDSANDRLKISVQDDGRGMDEPLLAQVSDPFVTSRTTRKVGLGIPLLKAAAEACNGHLSMTSALGKGTRLEAEFQRSHIDRMPLGDLAGTMLTLVVSFPEIHWLFHYRANGVEFSFDDEPIKKELGEIPLAEPAILAFIRELLEKGVGSVQNATLERKSYDVVSS